MRGAAHRIVEGAAIPSIPRVLQEILALTSSPDSSSRALEEKVLAEPGLVTYLLRTVNSAHFGLSRRVSSVQQAILLQGYASVRSMASGLLLIQTFQQLPGLSGKYLQTVWSHSLVTAGLTRLLADPRLREARDALMLAAMVHNIGHLVLARHFGGKYEVLAQTDPLPPAEEERKNFEVDHAEVGAAMLEQWRFDKEIVDLVRAHHDPPSWEGPPAVIETLALCEALARQSADLEEFLGQEESDADAGIIAKLAGLGWTWMDLQERSPAILAAVEAARQSLRA